MGNQQSKIAKQQMKTQLHQQQMSFNSQLSLFDVSEIQFPLSTIGMKIVDQTGRRVKLAGTNWSGGHAERQCPGGLDAAHVTEICQQIKTQFDMNVVRLTFSLQMFYDNIKIPEKHLKANPQMIGLTAMEIFDKTIEALTKTGLMVYLNNHTSKAQWCCSMTDGDGLWWSKEYPEEKYFQCLVALAQRYKNNPRVIGIDLRNQIRANYMNIPSWGSKNPKTDWHMAAEKIGNKIHEIAPHLLIIVGGMNFQLDLKPVKKNPIKLKIPNKLVYSGHLYCFSWPLWAKGYWKFSNYKQFYTRVVEDQLFVRNLGVPFIFGEFGNNKRDRYWKYMMQLFSETDIDWTYWCLDGYKCKEQENETYGLLNKDFKSVRYEWMRKDLKMNARPKKGSKMEEKEKNEGFLSQSEKQQNKEQNYEQQPELMENMKEKEKDQAEIEGKF